MKRYLPHITATLILITILVGGFGHVAQAADAPLFGYTFHDFVTGFFAEIVNNLLTISAWILALAGSLLNMSINLTLNIKEFLEGTPAIYAVWKSIRDISGMFLIFTLVFAALKMILAPIGVPGPSAGNLIKTVVVAGVLINFSFFAAGLGIDVSNVVSMQLYNTIAPASNLNYDQLVGNGANLETRFADGGLSDIFMKSLKISNFYDAKTAALNPSGAGGTPGTFHASTQIILGGVFGIVVMLTAAASFFLAALAFIVRFVVLLLLLGFSPIWFASFAVPDLKTYANKWTDTYKSQLLFMPVYLLLMYFALSILTSSNLFQAGFATNQSAGEYWWANYMILGINASIVIIMLNAPLLAAISVGAMMPKWAEGVGAGAIWKGVSGWAGGKTFGMAASKTDKYLSNTRIGNSLLGRDIRSATIGQVAKSKFGGPRSYDETRKELKDVAKKQTQMDRVTQIKNLIASDSKSSDEYKAIIKLMSKDEKLALGKDVLKNPQVMKHLQKSDIEAIEKSEDFKPEDISTLKTARKDAFSSAVTTGDKEVVKQMVKDMDIDSIVEDESLLANPGLLEHLSIDRLKKIGDSKVSKETKDAIARSILDWKTTSGGSEHSAFGWMSKPKNHGDWLKASITLNGVTYNPA
ncbi:MAG: hypothetical protein KBC33_01855 [Candidatus Pacebacteria bacterium]|nr:hypothetical protein [Candidatus Paceibacterota bacterium]